MITSDVVNAV